LSLCHYEIKTETNDIELIENDDILQKVGSKNSLF
jgi:hypothetical protein